MKRGASVQAVNSAVRTTNFGSLRCLKGKSKLPTQVAMRNGLPGHWLGPPAVGPIATTKAATLAGSGLILGSGWRAPYFWIWYTRSPASFLADSILIPRFFPAVERNPRTLCACQSVAFMISARVAPLARPIKSRILAPLLSARGVFSALAAFFAAFLVAGLAALALFLALGALFFGLAPFFETASVGVTDAPCSATVAAVSLVVASAFVMVFILSAVDPRMTIHHSGAAERQDNQGCKDLGSIGGIA